MAQYHWRRRHKCSMCGADNDTMSNANVNDKPPQPGDPTICLGCGYISIVSENGKRLRKPTPVEQFQLDHDYEIQKVIAAHRQFKRERSH